MLNSKKEKIFDLADLMIESYVLLLAEETEYQKYFKSMLSKFGVTSPNKLSDEKKKKFFSAVKKGWSGKKKK